MAPWEGVPVARVVVLFQWPDFRTVEVRTRPCRCGLLMTRAVFAQAHDDQAENRSGA